MNDNFPRLLAEFRKLKLPDGKYVIYGSGPLGVRGIREIHDLDVVVTDDLYQKLLKKYPKKEINDEKKKFIKLGKIELIPASYSLIRNIKKVIAEADIIDDLKFIKLEDLIKWKKKMARPKDFEDIKLIKEYLKKKKVKVYNKLIRDRILQIIERDGKKPYWRVLGKKKFLKELKKKILEEAREVIEAKTKKEIINEIVDLYQLLDTLSLELGLKQSEIRKQQKIKNKNRGTFKKKLFLIKTEEYRHN